MSDDFMTGLEDPPAVDFMDGLDKAVGNGSNGKPAKIRRGGHRSERERDRAEQTVRDLKSEMFHENATIVRELTHFKHVDPTAFKLGDPPSQKFLDQFYDGKLTDESLGAWRVALAGWMAKKDAPIAALNAAAIFVGMVKSDAMVESGAKSLQIAVVMGPPVPRGESVQTFPSMILEEGENK